MNPQSLEATPSNTPDIDGSARAPFNVFEKAMFSASAIALSGLILLAAFKNHDPSLYATAITVGEGGAAVGLGSYLLRGTAEFFEEN